MDKRRFLLLPAIGLAAAAGSRAVSAEGISNPGAVKGATLNGAGHLILTSSNGTQIDAGSVVAGQPMGLAFTWGGAVIGAGTYTLPAMPFGTVLTSVSVQPGLGNSFNFSVLNGGVPAGSLANVAVAGITTIAASGPNLVVAAGNSLSLVVSSVSATAPGAAVQINGTKS